VIRAGTVQDLHLFRQAKMDEVLGTIVWPNGADIAPGVLYDWPQHVDAIVERRRQRFAPAAPLLVRAQPKSTTGLDWQQPRPTSATAAKSNPAKGKAPP
jgi:hypothetical protein